MRGFLVVYRRELAGLFLSPLAWILFCVTLLFNGLVFLYALEREMGGEVNGSLSVVLGGGRLFWITLAFLAPLLTMRMISEESRSGMLEFLLTAPVSDAAVVCGKALAATTLLALLWGSVGLYGLATSVLGAPPDWGMVLTAWLGSVLVSALFCAIGLASSALFGTPLLAAFLAILADLGLCFLPALSPAHGRWGVVVEKVDVLAHYQGSFQTGALDSAHVVFFLAWTATLLFLATRLMERRRWL